MLRGPLVRSLILALTSGCSLVLDFSEDAIPVDAMIDGPFSQVECDFGEPNENASAPQPFDPSAPAAAAICSSSDKDFYRVTIPTNTMVELKINFIRGTSGDLDLRLYNDTGAMVITQSRTFNDFEVILCPGGEPSCPALAPGDYIFEIFPSLAGAINRYDLSVTITP